MTCRTSFICRTTKPVNGGPRRRCPSPGRCGDTTPTSTPTSAILSLLTRPMSPRTIPAEPTSTILSGTAIPQRPSPSSTSRAWTPASTSGSTVPTWATARSPTTPPSSTSQASCRKATTSWPSSFSNGATAAISRTRTNSASRASSATSIFWPVQQSTSRTSPQLPTWPRTSHPQSSGSALPSAAPPCRSASRCRAPMAKHCSPRRPLPFRTRPSPSTWTALSSGTRKIRPSTPWSWTPEAKSSPKKSASAVLKYGILS